MPRFNEAQRQWVQDFLRLSSQNETFSFDKLAEVGIEAAAKFGVPAEQLPAGARGASIGQFFGGPDVMMAAPAGAGATQAVGDKASGANYGSGGASPSTGQSGSGSAGGPPAGGGNGSGGGAAPQQTPYPGHKHTPPGSLPKAKPQPKKNETDEEKQKRLKSEEEERVARRQAERDLKKDPRDPKSVFDESALKKKKYKHIELGPAGGGGVGTHVDEHGNPVGVNEKGQVDPSKLHSDTELKKAMDEYLDPKNRKGKSLKDLKVTGKIGEPLHKELEAKGFVLQDREGRLKDFNRATGQMEYILRDSTFTTDLEVAKKKGVPQYIYVHEDGGMVRVKPEGTPGNQMRNEPNVSKSVLYKVEFDKNGKVIDTSFENEAFKVDEDGRVTAKQPTVGVKFGPDGKPLTGPDGKPIQKTPAETGGMKKTPRGATDGNAAAKKGVDDVAMEKGHVRAPITPIPGAPQTPPPNRQLGPGSPTTGAGGSPAAPSTPPATFDVNKLQTDTTAFVRKLEETKKAYDDLQTKLDKARLPSESEKLRKQSDALEKQFETLRQEGETLAKQIAAAPEMAGVTGATPADTVSKARERFGKVAGHGKAVGPILLQLQDAFELVESIRYIFKADSTLEGVIRAGKVGAGYAAGAAEFALARYLAGSSAVGWVVVGVLTMKSDQGEPSEEEKRKHRKWQREEAKKVAVGKMLDKLAPGSVILHKQDDYEWVEPKNTKLFESTLKQVDQLRRENLALEAKKKGIADGLTGAITPQTKFFPKEEDLDDLGITVKDLYAAYQEGLPVGKSQRDAAIKRAHDLGYKDGKAGKAADFEPVKQWPELRALTGRDLRKLNNDDFIAGQSIYSAFENSYQQGFDEGHKQAKSQVLTKLEITPNGFSMGGHTIRKIKATGVFSDKSTKDLSGEVTWQSSNEKIVTVHNNDGLVHAFLFNLGGAEVTATYQGVHGSATATIKVVVNPPVIAIMPENPQLKVGDKQQFRAYAIDPANDFPSELDASAVSWGSEDPSRLAIDAAGNATVLAAGRPVKVFASHHRSPAQSNTLVTVQ